MLDLFSGIGGFSLAAQWCWGDELEIVAFCEIDKFCQKVLRKHWPSVPIIEDVRDVRKEIITNFTGNRLETRGMAKEKSKKQSIRDSQTSIDLLTGGFPCQPFSVAGKRKGKEDDRYLWPECIRVVREIKPRWVVFENVPGIKRMVLDDLLSDLETEGYWNYIDKKGKGRIAPLVVGAVSVNAPHKRMRVWIVAHSEQSCWRRGISEGLPNDQWGIAQKESKSLQPENREAYRSDIKQSSQDVADTGQSSGTSTILRRSHAKAGNRKTIRVKGQDSDRTRTWWSTEPDVGLLVDGLSEKLDGGRLNEALRMVWTGIDSTSLEEWCIRQHIQESEILQLKMLRSMVDKQKFKSNNSGNPQKGSTGNRSKDMSRMRSDGECSKASREQEIDRHSLSEVSYRERNEEWNMGNPWIQEPNIPRVARGIKDRVNRLKSLGNAIVPQIAFILFKTIKEIEDGKMSNL